MPRQSVVQPIDGGAGWAIETQPPGAGAEHKWPCILVCTPRGRVRLTATGWKAVLDAIDTYYTAAKVTSLLGLGAAGVNVEVRLDGVRMTILGADLTSFAATLTALFQTAANVSP